MSSLHRPVKEVGKIMKITRHHMGVYAGAGVC